MEPNQNNNQGGNSGSGAAATTDANVINLQNAQIPTGTTTSTSNEADKYDIDPEMQKKYPVLIELVIHTESMTDDERQYWFQIMPVMTDEQLQKFKGILETEKKQLSKLDQEYEVQLKKLNDRHLIEWQDFESREKRRELKSAENKAEKEEKAKEEDLLKQLENL